MTPASPAPARELTEPVSLTRPDGRLHPDAIGWARTPLVDTTGLGAARWGRNKRWEYWAVTTPTHIVALTISSLDYAAVHEVWVFDRSDQRTWSRTTTTVPARGVELPANLDEGRARARGKGLRIEITPVADGTRLTGSIEGATFDIVAELAEGHERLAVVVPWSQTRFQYTVKDVARRARGTLTVDGRTHDLPAEDSWAVLDHGRGRWPHRVRWNWGAASGHSYGRVIGLQMGGRWTAGTGITENAVVVDGRLHKIHDELEWRYDIDQWRQPWTVRGGGLDATFVPFHNKVSRTNLGIVAGATDQCFGHWSGSYRTADGDLIPFDDVVGWAEDVRNRW